MRAAALVLLALLLALARSQSLCTKYAVAFGGDQLALLNETVSAVLNAVAGCADCPTLGWFNGTFGKPGVNYLTDVEAQQMLVAKFMGFFGKALGCNDAALNEAPYNGFSSNMRTLHANFQKAVNKAAFDYFNEQVRRPV